MGRADEPEDNGLIEKRDEPPKPKDMNLNDMKNLSMQEATGAQARPVSKKKPSQKESHSTCNCSIF